MKKILFISPNEIFGYGGGPISQQRIYYSLKSIEQENLIQLKVISLDKVDDSSFVKLKKSRKIDIKARIRMHSTYVYIEFKKIKNIISQYKPEIVILGSSRLGFIAKYIFNYNNKIKVITNFENVEYDYVDAYFLLKKSIKQTILKEIEKKSVYRDEKNSITYSDKLIYLTKRDQERCEYLYKCKNKKVILPICIKQNDSLTQKSEKKSIVFLGSLNYESNIDAILWFIKNVWEKYYCTNNILRFLIGGCNAPEYLKEVVAKFHNIELYNNFSNIKDIVPINSLFIAPIRVGAGMKVKVAEALSLGCGIIGSEEAFVGYEEIIDLYSENILIKKVETSKEYKKYIDEYLNKNERDINAEQENLKNIFYKFYSYDRAKKIIKETLFH